MITETLNTKKTLYVIVPVITRMNILINFIVNNGILDGMQQLVQEVNASGNLW
jgi:hypothetical protein